MAAAPAPAAAPPQTASSPSTDVGYLRSVRSEALVGEDGGRASRWQSDVDDLKRIRGIGVLIEKKLNSLGILSYEQVANWTGTDIERISNILDFKGRIERENWIEQARILAAGGQTEFSRRGER
jgi:predicted flap endonuclease-1-like 5' DNA nuclease